MSDLRQLEAAAGQRSGLPWRRGGKRVLTFDNARTEIYESIFVQHDGGEWDRILVARDDGSDAALIAALRNAAPYLLDLYETAKAFDTAQREYNAAVAAERPDPLPDLNDPTVAAEWFGPFNRAETANTRFRLALAALDAHLEATK